MVNNVVSSYMCNVLELLFLYTTIQVIVVLYTEDPEDASDSEALTATFICVAVDSKTGEAVPVNRLLPETKQEKALFEETEARNSLRKSKRGKELENGEVLITKNRVEAMLAEGWIFNNMPSLADRESILMRETRLESSLICQPQHRNMHGRVFGGFLIYRAFKLAFSTAYAFAGLVS